MALMENAVDPAPTECAWTEAINFAPETKEWLGGLEWPPTAYADFRKVGDHNDLRLIHCK